jgi:hypothetical protein
MDWTQLARDSEQWRALASTINERSDSMKRGEFFDKWYRTGLNLQWT